MAASLLLHNLSSRNPSCQTLPFRPSTAVSSSTTLLHTASLFPSFASDSLRFPPKFLPEASIRDSETGSARSSLIGEESAALGSQEQKDPWWIVFTAVLVAAWLVFDTIRILNSTSSRKSIAVPIASLSNGNKILLQPLEEERPANCDGSINTKKKLKMVVGASDIPKRKPQGEDAYFVCEAEQTVGVADGVGGWAKKGIDAGEYARLLMDNSAIAVHNYPKGAIDPKKVLQEAYSNTKAQGSCTALIVTLKDRSLYAANVGDSCFALFRGKHCFYHSPVQLRGFNYPYQLGYGDISNNSSSCMELRVEVEPGDIMVVGTDGLFDNVYSAEIEDLLSQETEEIDPERFAWKLAQKALHNSMDTNGRSPFSKAAQEAGFHYIGGKPDDITVIVAQISCLNLEGGDLFV